MNDLISKYEKLDNLKKVEESKPIKIPFSSLEIQAIKLIIDSNNEGFRKEIEAKTNIFRDEIESSLGSLRDVFNNILENDEWLEKVKKSLFVSIEQEIRVRLSKDNLRDIIKKMVKSVIEEDYKSLIKDIVNVVFNKLFKDVDEQYKRTKSLIYSCESEIKHLIRDLPICLETEKVIKRKFDDLLSYNLDKIDFKKNLLEIK